MTQTHYIKQPIWHVLLLCSNIIYITMLVSTLSAVISVFTSPKRKTKSNSHSCIFETTCAPHCVCTDSLYRHLPWLVHANVALFGICDDITTKLLSYKIMVQSSSSSVEEKPRIKMCTFKLESAMLKNRVPTSYTVHERNGAQQPQDGNMGKFYAGPSEQSSYECPRGLWRNAWNWGVDNRVGGLVTSNKQETKHFAASNQLPTNENLEGCKYTRRPPHNNRTFL